MSISAMPLGKKFPKKTVISPGYVLNSTGEYIWEKCDGKTSIREITTELHEQYKDISYTKI